MTRPRYKLSIRVLLYRSEGLWFAHCLDFSLSGHGTHKMGAIRSMLTSIAMQAEHSAETGAALFIDEDARFSELYARSEDAAVLRPVFVGKSGRMPIVEIQRILVRIAPVESPSEAVTV